MTESSERALPHRSRRKISADIRDLSVNPFFASVITGVMLIGCTWLISTLETLAHVHRPYTLFYIVPVAFGAGFLGTRGGLTTAIASVLLARLYLFDQGMSFWAAPGLADDIELFALAFGTCTVAIVTGRLRSVLSQLNKANIDLRNSEERRKGFNREVLLAVTGGRLMLCDDQELREMLPTEAPFQMALNQPQDASVLRHAIQDIVYKIDFPAVRLDDICTAATEAATNAVKHGSGGTAFVWVSPSRLSVLVKDQGTGISPTQLARATLERGFSTRISLGMGYYMMLEAVDNLALSTSPQGTSVLLTVGEKERTSLEQNLLAHYTGF